MVKQQRYIGVMSGTSLDGVDTVMMDFSGARPEVIAAGFLAMPQDLREILRDFMQTAQVSLQQLGEADHRLALLYAEAVNQLLQAHHFDHRQIAGIGCHGQTIWHSPTGKFPFTMQIGDANIVAAKTGITTVADFRRKDMAYGGQGAPLVPAFHQAMFARPNHLTVVLNIGGISNISILSADGAIHGYDTGPGNVLLDAWIEQQKGPRFDRDGLWAKRGTVDPLLLERLLQDPFFKLAPPKSTGRELFNLTWLHSHLCDFPNLRAEDVQASLLELTVQSIRLALSELSLSELNPQILVCGGGAKNRGLMARLEAVLTEWQVATTEQHGMQVDHVEAAAFAWLARQRLAHLPANIPAVTGAKRATSLGAIYPMENETYDRK